MKKILVLLSLALLLFAGCSAKTDSYLPPLSEANKWDDVVLATNNGTTITMSDYVYWYRLNQNDMENTALNSGLNTEENVFSMWEDEASATRLEELRNTSLADAKQYAELLRLASEAGTQLDQSVADERNTLVDDVAITYGETSEEQEKGFYDYFGITIKQMKDAYINFAIIDQYLAELRDSIDISDEELLREYESSPDDYEQVIVRHILILSNEDMTDEERKDAEELANILLGMLEAGADIGELAKEYSEDPGSKDNNGEYMIYRGMTVPEFEEWSFSAQPGDRGIIITDYGYHVMEFVRHAEMDDLRDTLRYAVSYDKVNDIVSEAEAKSLLDWDMDEKLIAGIKPYPSQAPSEVPSE